MDNINDLQLILDELDSAQAIKINEIRMRVKNVINLILGSLENWVTPNNDILMTFVSHILSESWWVEWIKVNPESKWILLENPKYWKFATWMLDMKWKPVLDDKWVPLNFTLMLKVWWNLLRLNSWNIRFTKWFKKN